MPVRVGGVWINPGDLLHGDRNGVTTIPPEIAASVAGGCSDLAAAENVVLDYLKSGPPTGDGFAAVRNECGKRINALAARLKWSGSAGHFLPIRPAEPDLQASSRPAVEPMLCDGG